MRKAVGCHSIFLIEAVRIHIFRREWHPRMKEPTRNLASIDRVISLSPGLVAIPEKLLLAHARGEVLFIGGAGISKPADLPDFRVNDHLPVANFH